MKKRTTPAPEYEMTEADWIALKTLMDIQRMVCTQGIAATRRQARAALKDVLSPPRTPEEG